MKIRWPQTGTLADIGIVIIAVALVAQVGYAMLGSRPPPASSAAARTSGDVPVYRVNETLPQLNGVDLTAAKRTLLMFVRSTCRFCTESMPFYVRLDTALRASKSNLRILALSHESQDVLETYLRTYGLTVDGAVSLTQAEYRQLKVRGTPTLILADQSGLIRRLWVGRIRPESEEAFIADLLQESR